MKKDNNKLTETCRERLGKEHPEQVDPVCGGGCFGCPRTYDYADTPDYCDPEGYTRCTECWDRPVEIGAEDNGPTA